MRVTIRIEALERVGELAKHIVEILSRVDVFRPRRLVLRDYDRGEVSDDEVFAVAARDAKGGLAMRTRSGTIHLSWRYASHAWFQLVGGSVNVSQQVLLDLIPIVRELSLTVRSAYSTIELETICDQDASAFSGEGEDDPWSRLDDLYWYNYFGRELTHALRTEQQLTFDIPGVSQKSIDDGWEVRIDGPPRERPYPTNLEKYLRDSGIFRKYSRKARFKSAPIQFDFSRVRTGV